MGFLDRLQHGWNAFRDNPEQATYKNDGGYGYTYRPDRPRIRVVNERTMVNSIINRIAIDVAAIDIKHVKLDDDGRYSEDVKSGLNWCLSTEANIDQTHRAFIMDVVISMFDEGVVAVVPVDTTVNPRIKSYDIKSMRTGKIISWRPNDVQVRVYNETVGRYEELWLPKKMVCIIENPLYMVVNEPNSTMKRLTHKLSLLDYVDEQSSSGKLDLIIQLPYSIKTEARKREAEKRRQDIVEQLTGSKYGIAYTDGTERVTQLNRPIENNLMNQIEYLTTLLYSQLGITKEVMEGTADEKTMLNYYSRTIEPVISAIVDEMKRKFLTKTARSQNQSIEFFRDPFKLVPLSQIADIGEKFTRNEIMVSNEIRQFIGMKPRSEPNADELRNKNLNPPEESTMEPGGYEEGYEEGYDEDYDEQSM